MIKYNRAVAFFIIMALTAMFCVGCSQGNTNAPQNGDSSEDVEDTGIKQNEEDESAAMTTSEIAQYILDNVEFDDQMNAISTELFLGLYNLEEDIVDNAIVYESTGATAEEFAVITVDSDEDMDQVKTAVECRIQSQRNSFEDYVPSELDKLNEPVIVEIDDTLVFIVCNDNKNAKKLLEDMNK